MRDRAVRLLSFLLLAAGFAFMAGTLREDADQMSWAMLPNRGLVAVLIAVLGLSLLVSYAMWIVVLESTATRESFAAYLTAQAAKYIPGGIWHGIGQVTGHARTTGSPDLAKAGVGYLVQALAQVAAGSAFGVLAMALGMSTGVATTVAIGVVAGSAALLYRPWMVSVLSAVRRRRPSWTRGATVPAQRRVIFVASLGLMTLGLQGWVLSALLLGVAGPHAWEVIAAYGVSWTIGWLVIPLPAGLGLREFLLVGLLPDIDPGVVVAASLAMRVGQVVAEALLAAASQALHRLI